MSEASRVFTDVDVPSGFAPPQPPDLLDRVVNLARRVDVPRVIIDGPSGSGKSTLGRQLAAVLDAELVQLDHVYASWDGLAAAGQHVAESLLAPLAAGRDGGVQHWDWQRGAKGKWQSVPVSRPVVIEGSAALNRATAPLATLRLWVEVADPEARKIRALEQRSGGDIYAPYWDSWGAQERAHILAEGGAALADIGITPGVNLGDPVYRLAFGGL